MKGFILSVLQEFNPLHNQLVDNLFCLSYE